MQSWRQFRGRIFQAALVCLAGILCLIPSTWAAEQLPANIDGGLGYLYEFAEPETTTPFEVERLAKLMTFILTPKDEVVSIAGRSGAFLEPLAYHEFAVSRSLPFILKYAHQSGIPPHLLTLGTLRYAYWKGFDDRYPDLPNVSERILQAKSPFVIRGREHEVIAPDPSSGAYYGYDLYRTLIGFRYGKYTIWIPMARQQNQSEVGRKGYVLDEENA